MWAWINTSDLAQWVFSSFMRILLLIDLSCLPKLWEQFLSRALQNHFHLSWNVTHQNPRHIKLFFPIKETNLVISFKDLITGICARSLLVHSSIPTLPASRLSAPHKRLRFAGGKVRPQLGDDPQEALSLEINCWDLFMGSGLAQDTHEMPRARERKREGGREKELAWG